MNLENWWWRISGLSNVHRRWVHRNLLMRQKQYNFLVSGRDIFSQISRKEAHGQYEVICPIIVKTVIMLIYWERPAVALFGGTLGFCGPFCLSKEL